jgi:type I restriction enzyme, S subunit
VNKATADQIINKTQNNRTLPKSWRWVRLGELIREAQPGFAIGERDPNGGIQLRMNNVDTRGHINWAEFIRVPVSPSQIEKFCLLPGDVVFNNTNSTELVGKSAQFISHDEPVVYSNHFTRIRVKENQLDSGYLAAWLLNQWQKKVFENLCNRWIGQSAVKSEKLFALLLPLPPLPEQKRIAAILNEQMKAVEKARAAAEAQLKAAKILPAAYLRFIFNSPEAQKWPMKNLGDICRDISDGTHFTPTYVEQGVPFLSVKDIKGNGISFENCRYITERQHIDLCRRCKPEKGDVLYTKVGTTGIAKAIDTERKFSIFVSVALLKLKSEVLPYYLERVLNSPRCKVQAENLTQGMANRNLVLQDLKRIELPIPSIAEQKTIIAILNEQMGSVEKISNSLKDQLETVNKLPAALLKRAFEGGL